MSDEVTWFDYDDLARVFGIERESARRLVIRKRWKRSKGNDGRARVAVPTDALPPVTLISTGERTVRGAGDVTGELRVGEGAHVTGETDKTVTGESPVDTPSEPVPEPVTAVLVRHVERLEAEIADLRTRVSDRDTIAIQVEALRAVLDEVRQDRDRWYEAATRTPEPVSHRPWWSRLVG